ncbi:MAG: hypothetical protein ABI591_02465 [Kofleriaceae bacterium]
MRTALAIVLAFAACKKAAAPEPKPEPVGSGSAVAVVAPPTGDTAADQTLRDEIMSYTFEMVPLLAAWDGDCTKQIERMKQLEPLVQQIRKDEAKVAPGFDDRIRQYMMAHKAEVVGNMQAAVAATKLSQAQLEAKDAEIKAKCTGQDYADEINKIGVMKKQRPNPPPPSPTP